MVPRLIARLALIVPFAAFLTVACEDDGPTNSVDGPLAVLEVTPTPVSVGTNASVQFTVVGRDANNNMVPIPLPVTWSVETAAAGDIDADLGLFTASATTATYSDAVRATSGDIFGNATVTVTSGGPLATLIISPNPTTIGHGNTRQFTATGKDAAGTFVVVPAGLSWAVVNGGGTINSSTGLFTAGETPGDFLNTTEATSGSISALATVKVTSPVSVGPSLGTASEFAVLGSTAISCVGVSSIAGSVGVAPAGSVSGFPAPCVIAAPGDPVPHVNDADANVAQADVTPAFNALAAMACGTELTDQDLGGMVLPPGVYCFSSSAQLTGNLELAGPSNGLWVFQVATALTTGTSAEVLLSGGAVAKNVFWQVGSSATLGQTTIFKGNVIAGVSVTLVQGSSLVGRALSKAGITMDGASITLP